MLERVPHERGANRDLSKKNLGTSQNVHSGEKNPSGAEVLQFEGGIKNPIWDYLTQKTES